MPAKKATMGIMDMCVKGSYKYSIRFCISPIVLNVLLFIYSKDSGNIYFMTIVASRSTALFIQLYLRPCMLFLTGGKYLYQ
jgi:hypothetical protein